jgi:K+-transporting ATPase c subunit
LPVANIFGAIIGKVQEHMLALDISQVHESGSTFFSSADTAYIIFLIIGIVGYFCVPSIAGFVVHATANSSLVQKVNASVFQSTSTTISSAQHLSSTIANKLDHWADSHNEKRSSNNNSSSPSNDSYMAKKLSGDNK